MAGAEAVAQALRARIGSIEKERDLVADELAERLVINVVDRARARAQPRAYLEVLEPALHGRSARRTMSAKRSAIVRAESSPSGRYHFGIQLIAPRIAKPAVRASCLANAPWATPAAMSSRTPFSNSSRSATYLRRCAGASCSMSSSNTAPYSP